MTYKVTNQRLFDSKLSDVNLTTLRRGRDIRGREGITGDVTLVFHPKEGKNHSQNYSGCFYSTDFEEEYGFVLVIPDNQ